MAKRLLLAVPLRLWRIFADDLNAFLSNPPLFNQSLLTRATRSVLAVEEKCDGVEQKTQTEAHTTR